MGNLLSVGRISKLYGLGGEVTITLYDNFPDNIDLDEPLYVRVDRLAVPLFIESFERRGRRRGQVLFADIDNQRRAEEFVGVEIYVRSADVKSEQADGSKVDDGALFLNDLVGFRVFVYDSDHRSDGIYGRVSAFIDSEMNPLWEIELEGERVGSGEESRYLTGRRVLIPAVDHFIVVIDTDERILELSVPSGLLDL